MKVNLVVLSLFHDETPILSCKLSPHSFREQLTTLRFRVPHANCKKHPVKRLSEDVVESWPPPGRTARLNPSKDLPIQP